MGRLGRTLAALTAAFGNGRVCLAFGSLVGCNVLTDVGSLNVKEAPVPSSSDGGVSLDAATTDASTPPTDDGGTVPPDTTGNGSGKDGSLTITAESVVNAYAAVKAALAVGARAIEVDDSTPFANGDAVLLWQSSGLATATVGDATPLSLGASQVGTFELVHVATKQGSTLNLNEATSFSYAGVTQAVRVPEYQELKIASAGRIKAPAYNGKTGGIVAFLVAGTFDNGGLIDVNELGFRGAVAFTHPTAITSCPDTEGVPRDGYAAKGEGPYVQGYTPSGGPTAIGGRGNFASGGGGGLCHNAGGGGGGHAGAGGRGGRSGSFTGNSLVGGNGGASVVYNPFARLLFGGGGGAGDADADVGGSATNGGNGGGVILIRARAVTGAGSMSANGGSGAPISGNGGGGGGAGGLIVVDVTESVACGKLTANGGNGSNVDANRLGTTGGGGGGRVILRSMNANAPCAAEATGGRAGVQNDASAPDGPEHGATAGAAGVTEHLSR